MVSKERPSQPFQELAVDFCSYGGQQFLISVDCCTDWPEITDMGKNTTTSRLLSALLTIFSRYGTPDVVWSDQGPQFTSQAFRNFSRTCGFRHITSSPTYPQSNGKAEAAVKSMKKLIGGAWTGRQIDHSKLAWALLQYRNTPSQRDGLSPAQKLLGRPLQDTIPAHQSVFAQPGLQQLLPKGDPMVKQSAQWYYNQRTCSLPDIQVGTTVAVQNGVNKRWDIYGKISKVGPFRQYHVKLSNGRVLVRNRRFIRRRVHPAPVTPPLPLVNRPVPIPSSEPRRSSRARRPPLRYADEFASS